MSNIQLWNGPNGIDIPKNTNDISTIANYATALTHKQKSHLTQAFSNEAYDMAAEYAWRKAMVRLKETLSSLGMLFIGEMLGRPDIDEFSTADSVLTDYTAIQLAEQLGTIGATAALKLRQANELITHFFSNGATEEIDVTSATQILKSSIQYILGEQEISIALEFSKFRDSLLSKTLLSSDPQIEQLVNSPLFYIRTVVTILLSAIKSDEGAKQENALGNLNLLTPLIWKRLAESDKWNVGTTYRDVTASGDKKASSGIKNALLKVRGFDFVPENLRSRTFQKAAASVLEVHFAFNNFYNEPAAVNRLANLGSVIPSPALPECMQAYLAVYLGNPYGVSVRAAEIAETKLSEILSDRWKHYFEFIIHNDTIVLSKIEDSRRVERFSNLLNRIDLVNLSDLPKDNQALFEALEKPNIDRAISIAKKLLRQNRG